MPKNAKENTQKRPEKLFQKDSEKLPKKTKGNAPKKPEQYLKRLDTPYP